VQSSSQIVITSKPTPSFLQAGCPSCGPTNSVRALNVGELASETIHTQPISSLSLLLPFQWPLIISLHLLWSIASFGSYVQISYILIHNLFTGRMPWSGKLLVISLLTGQKSAFLPHRGNLLHQFTWNLARPRGTRDRLATQNFMPIGSRGWEQGPQNCKNFHFLVKSCPTGANPLSDFYSSWGFYTPNYPTLVFQIWCDLLHRLRSYCWETAHWSIRPNFSVHPVGKTVLDRKMINIVLWSWCALSPCKIWRRLYNVRRL